MPNQPPTIPSKTKTKNNKTKNNKTNTANFMWQTKPPYAKNYLMDGKYGTQVVRCWDIYDSAKNVTAQFQAALVGTPWANYMLVGAQWAEANASEFPSPVMPFAAPFYLTNTTLETYLQLSPIIVNGKPSNSKPGSCIACHNLATDSAQKASNLSFLPSYAK